MMDQSKWKLLEEAFEEEEPWWEGKYADESEFPKLDLMDWLECSSTCPSWKMQMEFMDHGYSVFCVERDSFGWLIGGVKRKNDPAGKVIAFG